MNKTRSNGVNTGNGEGAVTVGKRTLFADGTGLGWGVRLRVTTTVTVVFAVAAIIGAMYALNVVEHRLNQALHRSAENILMSYVLWDFDDESTDDGVPQFLYLDSEQREISELLLLVRLLDYDNAIESCYEDGQIIRPRPNEPVSEQCQMMIDLEDQNSETLGFGTDGILGVPISRSDIVELDRGPDVVALAIPITGEQGDEMMIGVMLPRDTAETSLEAVSRVVWTAVPVLIVTVAVLSWLVAGFALRPVDAMRRRAETIRDERMGERLPVPPGRDEVASLATTLNNMLERLQQTRDQRQRFLTDAAHELRSPVSASLVQLESAVAAEADGHDAEWMETAQTVITEQIRLNDMVEDLLALARMNELGQHCGVEIDLDDVIEVEAERPRSCPVVATTQPVKMIADEAMLIRALSNLLDNAARYATDHVDVVLTVRDVGPVPNGRVGRETEKRRVIIEVIDDGPGVPEEERERIFERFARVDQARAYGASGAGLGLTIVAEVVHRHGGTVTVTDREDGCSGARFVLVLPVVASPGNDLAVVARN